MKRIILLIWAFTLLLISSKAYQPSNELTQNDSSCPTKLTEKCFKIMTEIKKSVNLFLSHKEHAKSFLKEGFELDKEIIYDLKKIIYRKIEAMKNLINTK